MKKSTIFAIVSVLATLLATTLSTSACWWWAYQPEEPDCLKDR